MAGVWGEPPAKHLKGGRVGRRASDFSSIRVPQATGMDDSEESFSGRRDEEEPVAAHSLLPSDGELPPHQILHVVQNDMVNLKRTEC